MWKLIDQGFRSEGMTTHENEAFDKFSADILLGRPSQAEDLVGAMLSRLAGLERAEDDPCPLASHRVLTPPPSGSLPAELRRPVGDVEGPGLDHRVRVHRLVRLPAGVHRRHDERDLGRRRGAGRGRGRSGAPLRPTEL